MNLENLKALIKESRERQDAIMLNKGAEYTIGNEDRGKNFKQVAEDFGVDPMLVWAIYLHKHIDAIYSFVKTGSVKSESIESRFDDSINYLVLGMMLVKDRENGK